MKNKPLAIGLVGTSGSGKTTAALYLASKGYYPITLSSFIIDEAKMRGFTKITKTLLQDIGNELRSRYGGKVLAKMAVDDISSKKKEKAVIDGIRNPFEIDYLREKTQLLLLGIDASERIRYRRIIRNRGKTGIKSFEDFLTVEERDSTLGGSRGQRAYKCFEMSEKTIVNNSTTSSFYQKLDKVINDFESAKGIMNIIILGKPGSGKGTQAKLLAKKYSLRRLSVGALIRRHVAEQTKLGKKAASYMLAGKAIPGKLLLYIIKKWIEESDKGFVIDNIVRSKEQLESYKHFQKQLPTKIDMVFLLNVSEDIAIERMKERARKKHRVGHTLEVIQERFATFNNSLSEVKAYFKSVAPFEEIDATRSIEDVHQQIIRKLEKFS